MTAFWEALRSRTPARVGLCRAGDGVGTRHVLEAAEAHAFARDAVHGTLDVPTLGAALDALGLGEVTHLASAAPDRATYLTRPDLGRVPAQPLPTGAGAVDLAVVLADGLSAEAVERHAVPVVRAPVPLLDAGTTVAPPAVATQARVALGDHVGAARKARLVLVLIGERPGLSSSDSLAGLIAGARRIGATGVRLKDPGGLVRPPGSEELH